MRLLLDTQLVLWVAMRSDLLPVPGLALIQDPGNEVAFSVVNLWEIAIKRALGRPDFQFDPRRVRQRFLNEGYAELAVNGDHAVTVGDLPPIHRDPFDRLLIAQARSEGLTLLTTDRKIAGYPGDIRRV